MIPQIQHDKFELYDIGDDDTVFWIAEDNHGNILARGYIKSKVYEEACAKVNEQQQKEVSPTSPNFENTDISFLMRD